MSTFIGSPYNVSPLCQGCFRVEFASRNGFRNNECTECKKAYEVAKAEYEKSQYCDFHTKEET